MISNNNPACRSMRAIVKRSLVCAGITVAALASLFCLTVGAQAENPPSPSNVESAQKTSDLMLATLFAALSQEFAETTPANVEQGKKSISLIFNDRNDDMRLVGMLQPLKISDLPQDSFEATALARAMQGQPLTDTQKVRGKWYYRRSIPLSNFHPACAMCHTNFGPVSTQQWVGALMLRVPLTDRDED